MPWRRQSQAAVYTHSSRQHGQRNCSGLLVGDVGWDVEDGRRGGDGVFGEGAMFGHHDVEGGHALTFLVADDFGPDGSNGAGDVVTRV